MSVPRTRAYTGPALLSYGFRPFFLFGAIQAAAAIAIWLPVYFGDISIPSQFGPVDWHVHEVVFGYLPAIVTGFLFTAVPNWTGRMPLQGTGLVVLLVLWFAGRIAVSCSQWIGWQAAMLIDGAFLAAVALVIAREIIAGRNWRNLKVLIPLGLFTGANFLFHIRAEASASTEPSRRLAFGAVLLLIMIVGGRIVPSFTRNWLVRENPGRLPSPFGIFDKLAIGVTVFALGAWAVMPGATATGILLSIAGFVQLARLARWAGYRTLRDPLVWILHASYGFLALGLFALGLSIGGPSVVPPAAAYHTLGIGAIGGMTLSVMVRATRGHTGQALYAGTSGKIAFTGILVAAAARFLAEYLPGYYGLLLYLAALSWVVAFASYALAFAPALSRKRKP